MNPESTDKLFRDRLYDMESEVSDAIWSQVESRLKTRPNRRYWLMLLLLIPLALALRYAGPNLHTFVAEEVVKPDAFTATLAEPSSDHGQVPLVTDEDEKVLESTTNGSVPALELPIKSTQSGTVPPIKEKFAVFERPSDQLQLSLSKSALPVGDRRLPSESENHHEALPVDRLELYDFPLTQQMQEAVHPLTPLDLVIGKAKDPKLDICPTFSSEKKHLVPFLELAVQVGQPMRTLDARSSEFEDYRQLRENTERTRFGFEVHGLVGLELGNHLEVKSGIGFRQINEVFDYIDENASRRTTTIIVVDTIFNSGIPTIVYDTSVVREYGQRIKRSNNRLQFLEVPIIGGYRFNMGRHRILVSGGVALQLAFSQKGDVLAPDDAIVPLDQSQSDAYPIFKPRAALDILTTLGYAFELNEINTLTAMASFRWPTAELTRSSYPLLQKYTSVNLGLAIKHRF
ncbi:MAG: hypothetical protein HKN87_07825 [Saprospiraceae bacterium]|nr:hypothetical protein [Saprospiraceae bacterium]